MTEHERNEVAVEDAELEKKMYKSCLKQVVEFLNTTLPPIEDFSEVENKIKKQKLKKKASKKVEQDDDIVDEKNSYKIRDVTPSRVFTKLEPKKDTSKRVNKYSERKYNDIKDIKRLKKRS